MASEDSGLHERLIPPSNHAPSKSMLSQRSDSSQPDVGSGGSPGVAAQSRLLIYKNVVLTFRNPKNLVFLITTPFLLSLFLFVFQGLARDNGSRTKIDSETYALDGFTRCYGHSCVSLHYRVIANSHDLPVPPWVDYAIDYIKLETGFGSSDITTGPNIVDTD